MKSKQYEYILRAFLDAKVPDDIKCNKPDLISIDSALGGYCKRVLGNDIDFDMKQVITKDDKKSFSELINHSKGEKKVELIIYYRLAILTEEVLFQCVVSN
jgi:hypothetical protein